MAGQSENTPITPTCLASTSMSHRLFQLRSEFRTQCTEQFDALAVGQQGAAAGIEIGSPVRRAADIFFRRGGVGDDIGGGMQVVLGVTADQLLSDGMGTAQPVFASLMTNR
ncbi:hypothetical protein GCM10009083_17300 [Halopseudomonas pertucinogena]|uniref:Uncharacterized protein n=1 Tax=Halopseudomonas pertucinogena TaxID=86175 RepID=A0ABQ2CR69_9GAMM|nr:hypothetical protein GCM10009083_17300 [Halopseudomonas pertucinogena]